jgi:hypothetical protein
LDDRAITAPHAGSTLLQTQGAAMLAFQWDALKVGDHVLVHEDADPRFGLRDGTVAMVDTRPGGGHDVGIRITSGVTHIERPRRSAVHLVPLDTASCWRCELIAAPADTAGVR